MDILTMVKFLMVLFQILLMIAAANLREIYADVLKMPQQQNISRQNRRQRLIIHEKCSSDRRILACLMIASPI